jgi:uncharacterized protein DUF7002
MSPIAPDEFVECFPRLWHMAEAGSWESVRENGLLSTTALLDLFEVTDSQRYALESCRRPQSVTISHPVHGTAVIRDNIPLIEKVLVRTLVGMTPREWYEALNRRVFFWVSESRVEELRQAPAYRDRAHDILVVDSEALLARHLDRITLSPMNSGATHPGAQYPRGIETFKPMADYPWDERLAKNRAEPVVELAVDYAVPDIQDIVLDVVRR